MTTATTRTTKKRPAVVRVPFTYEKVDIGADLIARIEILAFIANRKAGKA